MVTILGPIKGEMACGEYGEEKCLVQANFAYLKNYFYKKNLVKQKFKNLITTGPTENI